jgi:hypothetical protein
MNQIDPLGKASAEALARDDGFRHRGYHEEDHTPAEHRSMAARQLNVVSELLTYVAANLEKGEMPAVAATATNDRDYYRRLSEVLPTLDEQGPAADVIAEMLRE